jgi:hypothetical protein
MMMLEVWLEGQLTVFIERTGRYTAHLRLTDSSAIRVGDGATPRVAIMAALDTEPTSPTEEVGT